MIAEKFPHLSAMRASYWALREQRCQPLLPAKPNDAHGLSEYGQQIAGPIWSELFSNPHHYYRADLPFGDMGGANPTTNACIWHSPHCMAISSDRALTDVNFCSNWSPLLPFLDWQLISWTGQFDCSWSSPCICNWFLSACLCGQIVMLHKKTDLLKVEQKRRLDKALG